MMPIVQINRYVCMYITAFIKIFKKNCKFLQKYTLPQKIKLKIKKDFTLLQFFGNKVQCQLQGNRPVRIWKHLTFYKIIKGFYRYVRRFFGAYDEDFAPLFGEGFIGVSFFYEISFRQRVSLTKKAY